MISPLHCSAAAVGIRTRLGNISFVFRNEIREKSGGPNWRQWQVWRRWHFLVVWPAPHWRGN